MIGSTRLLRTALGLALAASFSGCGGGWRGLSGASPVFEERRCTVTGQLVRFEVLDDTELNLAGDDDWRVEAEVHLPGAEALTEVPVIAVADAGSGADRQLDALLFSLELACGTSSAVEMRWRVSELDDDQDDLGAADQTLEVACDASHESITALRVGGTGILDSDGEVRLTTRVSSDDGCA